MRSRPAVAAIAVGVYLLALVVSADGHQPSLPPVRVAASEFHPVPTPSPSTPPLTVIVDTAPATAAPTHPVTRVPVAPVKVEVVVAATKHSARHPRPIATRSHVRGTATWYCLPGVSACPWMASSGLYAAAGPALRAALGGGDHCRPGPHCWRNRIVTVSGNHHTAHVELIDWCACPGTHAIDLFADVMAGFVGSDRAGRPLRGGFAATISW